MKCALRVWRDPLQKDLSTSIMSIEESFKVNLDTKRPAKDTSSLWKFGGGVSVYNSTTGGEGDSYASFSGAFDAAFSSPFLVFSLLLFALRASFSIFFSKQFVPLLFFAKILFFSFLDEVRGPLLLHLHVHYYLYHH